MNFINATKRFFMSISQVETGKKNLSIQQHDKQYFTLWNPAVRLPYIHGRVINEGNVLKLLQTDLRIQ